MVHPKKNRSFANQGNKLSLDVCTVMSLTLRQMSPPILVTELRAVIDYEVP